jgi:hypothetical protein
MQLVVMLYVVQARSRSVGLNEREIFSGGPSGIMIMIS